MSRVNSGTVPSSFVVADFAQIGFQLNQANRCCVKKKEKKKKRIQKETTRVVSVLEIANVGTICTFQLQIHNILTTRRVIIKLGNVVVNVSFVQVPRMALLVPDLPPDSRSGNLPFSSA